MYDARFKNINGKHRTWQLFYELIDQADRPYCVYTLKDREHQGYPSIKQAYLEMEDITEYDFANKYFDGWIHWERILNSAMVREHVNQWRKELELKIKAKALKALMKEAQEGGKESVSINKFLVQRGYVDKDTKGRPSKQQIKEEADRLASMELALAEDMERITTKELN